MSDENPYQAPLSTVEQQAYVGNFGEPQSLPPGHGINWISDGWKLFVLSPLVWVGILLLFWVMMIIMSIIPIVSIFTTILMPVFTAGFMLACRDLDQGSSIDVSHLFAGFKHRTGDLVALGAINLGIFFLLFFVLFIIMMSAGIAGGMFDMDAGDPMMNNPALFISAMMIPALILSLAIIPIMMLFWFAPAIIVFNEDIGVIEAMKLSFMGCLKNILPLTIYSLVIIVLAIVASIPVFLGWLILWPVLYATIYTSYQDIYITD